MIYKRVVRRTPHRADSDQTVRAALKAQNAFISMLFMQFEMENELDLHFGQVELRASPYSNLHDMQSEMLPLPIFNIGDPALLCLSE